MIKEGGKKGDTCKKFKASLVLRWHGGKKAEKNAKS